MRTAALLQIGLMTLALAILPGCTTPKQQPMPVGNLKLGLAHYTQPKHPGEMLAGYSSDSPTPIDPTVLAALNDDFASALRASSKNHFLGSENAIQCARKTPPAKQSALRNWAAVGRCMGVDLLVVPQLLEWRERDGGQMGVAKAAKVVMDTFVVDVANETLISRSRYDETQSALADNLLETSKFFKRGGKWVTTRDLAREGIEKAIKDLGL